MATKRKKKMTPKPTQSDMTVAPEILAGINQMRSQVESLLAEVGRVELHKTNMLQEVSELNRQANLLVKQESARLGIPEGAQWKITPEGKASVIEAG